MSLQLARRDPEMVARQKELLGEYRAAGVITEATYLKAIKGLEPPEPATQPREE